MVKRTFEKISNENDDGNDGELAKKARVLDKESEKEEKEKERGVYGKRPIVYTGSNKEEYEKSCLDIFLELSEMLDQNHVFIPRPTWVNIWGLTLAPLYLEKPEEGDIALFIDVNNNEDIYSTVELRRRKKDGKRPEPLRWTTDHAGYQTAVIRANEIRYNFAKHIAILHGALEIPYYVCHNRRKFQVDHKISRTKEGVLSNKIENLQYLSSKVHVK